MIFKYLHRMITEVDARLLYKFAWNFGWKGTRAIAQYQKRLKRGEHFPAFLFLSVTNNCNLRCQGCWVTPTNPVQNISIETLDKIILEAKGFGSYFFGILGGEPLLYKELLGIFQRHPDCYFILFTNGTLLTEEIIDEMHHLGNVSPLISIEGDEIVSDTRRGGKDVYSRTLKGLERCTQKGLITGVATSVCKSNIDDLTTESFVNQVAELGAHYFWYYIYRPVGPQPTPELALSREEVIRLRKFIVDIRAKAPLLIVDSYWDHKGRALCPAAVGIGHHINANGDVELCPPIQFACENVHNEDSLSDIFNQSKLFEQFRTQVKDTTRGCVIMDDPELLEKIVMDTEAYDSSGRESALQELRSNSRCQSHHVEGEEIPEGYWIYKFAKKNWFWGFGAYG